MLKIYTLHACRINQRLGADILKCASSPQSKQYQTGVCNGCLRQVSTIHKIETKFSVKVLNVTCITFLEHWNLNLARFSLMERIQRTIFSSFFFCQIEQRGLATELGANILTRCNLSIQNQTRGFPDFVLCPPPPPSETGWTGELWLNHILLILENKQDSIFFPAKKITIYIYIFF